MGAWTLLQVVFDIFVALGLFVIVMKMNRAPKDDPRMSRGLQLLQSKISVLEDLSDRTEAQVNQLVSILEQKSKEVQAKIQLAEQHVHAIRVSMERSLEVAKIFQDKIPHQEIIERQNTIKYVQAARLAHQGLSAEDIASKVDLPKGEIEFISKVNREQLMFNENELPDWVRQEVAEKKAEASASEFPSNLGHLNFQDNHATEQAARLRVEMELNERQRLVDDLSRLQFEMQNLDMQLSREAAPRDLTTAFDAPKVGTGSLQRLGDEFRKAVEENEKSEASRPAAFPPIEQLASLIPQVFGISQEETPDQKGEEQRDPVLSRALAQAKIQAALKRSVPVAAQPVPLVAQPELEAARAAARAARPEPAQPVVRKVQFPKIDAP